MSTLVRCPAIMDSGGACCTTAVAHEIMKLRFIDAHSGSVSMAAATTRKLLLAEEFQVCFFRRHRSYVVHLPFFAPLLAVVLLFSSGSGSWLFSSTLHEAKGFNY
ncbi:hypothetical protein PIB30_058428 [Stylosanthes scabra]|uniref:Uncharacterized protein n=1 Tax=Stylosanthes scabra TaxID=79078 RepID=A0ABU6XKM6_9FABA|nr:hypothetical protein [Stylosanthes scabra]